MVSLATRILGFSLTSAFGRLLEIFEIDLKPNGWFKILSP